MFEKLKALNFKYLLCLASATILLALILFSIVNSINMVAQTNQDIFAYTTRVRDAVEELDRVFERAEVNVNVMVDSIANSYDINKQQDKTYNLNFINNIDGLVKSVLSNSPGINGSWFQLNADLPYSSQAYNWYEFKDNQFVDIKDQFEGAPSAYRKITPEDDPYYFNAIDNKKPTWSDIYTDADTKDSMMTISAPIYKDGLIVGVVGIDISTNNLQNILANMQSSLRNSELYLLDTKNKVILSQLSDKEPVFKDDYPFLALFKEHKRGPIEYYDQSIKKTAIILKLSNDYKVVIAIENKILFSETSRIITLVVVLFLLLISTTAIAFINQYRITKIKDPTIVFDLDTKKETEDDLKSLND